ncbi:methionine synthase [Cryptosporangium minutisporangium]|uniref:5-methyltetrahydropteroyltriglutamate--homocysteine S-methyltransferase n=1 Tax=Cryptosporangium minutisporangium TaxID=113569 RepID=A0ABP6T4M2_9ACTN
MADDFKYHIDHHARLLPPPALVEARATGVSEAELTAVEDAAISAALLEQRRLALLGLSDGEFRRPHRLSVVYGGIDGFGSRVDGGPFGELLGPDEVGERRPLLDTPVAHGRLTKHETGYLLAGVQRSTMLTLPSPGLVAALGEASDEAATALAAVIRDEVAAVAADGIRYVLLTNPLYGHLLSVAGRARAAALGIDAGAVLRQMLAVDAQVLDGLELGHQEGAENFRIGLDLTTSGAVRGGYDDADLAWFVAEQPFGRLCVEHTAAAPFPLPLLVGGLVVSLGLVDVSHPEPENVDDVVARVDAAAEVLDIDDIAISTNGAFFPGLGLTVAQQHTKLQTVEMAARYFWGNEL